MTAKEKKNTNLYKLPSGFLHSSESPEQLIMWQKLAKFIVASRNLQISVKSFTSTPSDLWSLVCFFYFFIYTPPTLFEKSKMITEAHDEMEPVDNVQIFCCFFSWLCRSAGVGTDACDPSLPATANAESPQPHTSPQAVC